MPRVAPVVRSARYEHAINTLVAKRAEIAGAIRFQGADLADQLHHVDAVLLILGYQGDPTLIPALKRKPSRFRKGELYRLILKHEAEGSPSNRETAERIVREKGWDTTDAALVKSLMQCVKRPRAGASGGGWRL